MKLKRRLYVLTASLAAVFFMTPAYASSPWYNMYHIDAYGKCYSAGINSVVCLMLFDPLVFVTAAIGVVVLLLTTRWLLLKLFPRLIRRV